MLPATAQSDGQIDLERLVGEGFAPVLHAECLPANAAARNIPLAGWEAERWLGRGEALFATGRLDLRRPARFFRRCGRLYTHKTLKRTRGG